MSVSPQSPSIGGGGQDGNEFGSGKQALPFEFTALEVCLELAFKFLEQEVHSVAVMFIS